MTHDDVMNDMQHLLVALNTPGLQDVLLTFDHPEFGIECTAVIHGVDATCTNQPDAASAIVNAIRLVLAKRLEEVRSDCTGDASGDE